MKYDVKTVDEYINALPEERKGPFKKLRALIKASLPEGFEECLSYGGPSFSVPHSLYPPGYHCKPSEPLPFISILSQKNYIGFYHMGISEFPDILEWFVREYGRLNIGKLDMGKSCIRLKKIDKIPYDLLGELCGKIQVSEWIDVYERQIKK